MQWKVCAAIRGVSIATAFWAAAVAAQQAPPTDSKRLVRPTAEEVRALVAKLQLRKQQEGWRFDVGETSALALASSELTGAESGLPSRGFLRLRQEFAERALRLYKAAKRKAGIPTGKGPHCRSRAPSFSWLDYSKVTLPQEQRTPHTPPSCGACWAFAPIGALESGYLIENGLTAGGNPAPVSASEQLLLNCTPNSDCGLGYVVNALDFLVRQGTTSRSESTYLGSKLQCLLNFSTWYRVVAWKPLSLDARKVNMPTRIKEALCDNGPVTARLIVTPSFAAYSGNGAYHQVEAVSLSDVNAHHVLIVGWDDSKGKNGAWLIKNSWVEGWGLISENMPGYAWVEYGANLIGHHVNAVQAFHTNVPVSLLGPQYPILIGKYLADHSDGRNEPH
jgi:C1A family cysteine protease